jgi:hypothetical protein
MKLGKFTFLHVTRSQPAISIFSHTSGPGSASFRTGVMEFPSQRTILPKADFDPAVRHINGQRRKELQTQKLPSRRILDNFHVALRGSGRLWEALGSSRWRGSNGDVAGQSIQDLKVPHPVLVPGHIRRYEGHAVIDLGNTISSRDAIVISSKGAEVGTAALMEELEDLDQDGQLWPWRTAGCTCSCVDCWGPVYCTSERETRPERGQERIFEQSKGGIFLLVAKSHRGN